MSLQTTLAQLRDILFKRHTGTGELAVAVGLGVCIGLTPFYGFQTLLAMGAAGLLGLNIAVTVLATQISNPLMIPFIVAASAWLGRVMRGGPDAAAWYDPTRPMFFGDWLRGGLALALGAGLLSGGITWVVLQLARRRVRHA